MKTLLFASSLILFASFQMPSAAVSTENTRIEIIFNQKLKFDDLVKIKSILAEKGITLDYQKLVFNEEKKLSEIDFKVDCQDGYSGSAAAKYLSNHTKFGFYRDYTPNVDSPFGTGDLSRP
jgi:hypothetical protein